ncbi:MAG: signal peptidase I [Gammaproteobacteria bacterium]|nr:signal peptidase I [Gammaproteobacteria bacterium]
MHFDFPTIMVLAVVVTGVIWGLDAIFWAPKRKSVADAYLKDHPGADDEMVKSVSKEPLLVEYAKSFFPVILVVLLLRSFLVEPFRIPSGSMLPTLEVGDFILVNKFSYGIRLPVVDYKVVEVGSPQRGDVLVFRYPKDPSTDYIKRVVGLPGDHIEYRNKTLYVNGQLMSKEYIGPYMGSVTGMPLAGLNRMQEMLDGVRHDILIENGKPRIDGEMIVPAGQYFVMGDNRDNSNDSRFWGTVSEEFLVGKAFMIWMNFNTDQGGVSWGRIGQRIE